MKNVLCLIALLASVALVGCATGVGDTAPEFTLLDTAGRSHSLQEHRGKVVVLEFWATWCGPCLEVSPVMEEIHHEYAELPVTVIGVHYNDIGDPAGYMQEHNLMFLSLTDGLDVADAYGVSKIPTIIIIDAHGKVVYRQTGFEEGDARTIRAWINDSIVSM